MRVHWTDDASEFLGTTLALRSAHPVRTNVLGSVATGVTQGVGYDDDNFFVVEDDAGEVVGAAVWTAPYKLLLSPMSDDAAVAVADAALARAAVSGRHPGGVVGPDGTAELAAARFGRPFRTARDERILVLHDYLSPRPVAGAARQPDRDDLDLLRAWRTAFAEDTGTDVTHDDTYMIAALPRTWLWEVDGDPVSMAGHAPIVDTPAARVGRIAPVYTRPDVRGFGYGTAATACVVDALLPQVDVVMLFTDAGNVTSNQVYEALGFVHSADVVEIAFDPA